MRQRADSIGYSGVAIYTKNATCAPIRAEEGVLGVLCPPKSKTPYRELPPDQQIGGYPTPSQLSGDVDEALLDSEGRCVVLEFPAFVLFGVYSPANRDESRVEFRESFVEALDARVRNLVAAGKQVILTGDLNIVRSEMDSSNIAENLRKEGMDMDEWQSVPTRRILNQLLFEGTAPGGRDAGREQPALWDICRCFHPGRMGMHTCWDTKRNTRPANVGSRIDYILCSDGLKGWFVDANIQEGLMGSDHCPVYATMRDRITKDGREMDLAEVMNPASMFREGRRVREWEQKDALPLSAKLIPEFDRRRNIRDMFTRKAQTSQTQMQTQSSQLSLLSQTPPSQTAAPSQTQPSQPLQTPSQNGEPNPQIEERALDTAARPDGGVAGADAGAEASSYFGSDKAATTPGPGEGERAGQSKRGHDGPAETPAAAKKSKGNIDGKGKVASGQRTLQGFFRPKNAANTSATSATSAASAPAGRPQTPPGSLASAKPTPTATSPTMSMQSAPTGAGSPGRVFDPIAAKESWSKLLGRRVVPRCEHEEPCISLVTKKPGVNCGTYFCLCL